MGPFHSMLHNALDMKTPPCTQPKHYLWQYKLDFSPWHASSSTPRYLSSHGGIVNFACSLKHFDSGNALTLDSAACIKLLHGLHVPSDNNETAFSHESMKLPYTAIAHWLALHKPAAVLQGLSRRPFLAPSPQECLARENREWPGYVLPAKKNKLYCWAKNHLLKGFSSSSNN